MPNHETRISDVAGFIEPLKTICETHGSTVLAISLTEDPEDPEYYTVGITCFGDDGGTSLERQSNILTEALLAIHAQMRARG
jgi:hypothetical protein